MFGHEPRVGDRRRYDRAGDDGGHQKRVLRPGDDLVVEADLGPYDYLAITPVVAGAGGKMTDWKGGELRANYDRATRTHSVEGLSREVVAAGDSETHAAALEKLAWK